MRVLVIPLALVLLIVVGLVALNLGVGWAAWVAAGAVFFWAFGAFFGIWPGGADGVG